MKTLLKIIVKQTLKNLNILLILKFIMNFKNLKTLSKIIVKQILKITIFFKPLNLLWV